jgi:hypothetical protein
MPALEHRFEDWHPGQMAGGMPSHRRDYVSLAERGVIRPPTARPEQPARPDPGSTRGGRHDGRRGLPRHCWVFAIDLAPGRSPGLLLEWRHTPDLGWEGRVIIGLDQDAGPMALEAWVQADHLRPVD